MSEVAGVTAMTDLEAFDKLLASSPGKLIVVDFHATWCRPCKAIKPKFVEFSTEFAASSIFLSVDVDEAEAIAEKYAVEAMPTFKLFKDGSQVGELLGADAGKLHTLIASKA